MLVKTLKKNIINLCWWVIKKNCSHENKVLKYTCYQDRYDHYYCDECKSDIYIDI